MTIEHGIRGAYERELRKVVVVVELSPRCAEFARDW